MNLTEKYLNLKIKSNGKYPKYFEIIAKMIGVMQSVSDSSKMKLREQKEKSILFKNVEKISDSALKVLREAKVSKKEVILQSGTLSRNLYEEIKDILGRIGGKWVSQGKNSDGSPRGKIVFDRFDAKIIVDSIIETGLKPTKNPTDYFPTPDKIIEDMLFNLKKEGIQEKDYGNSRNYKILEPSAGTGAIADKIREYYPNGNLHCVEFLPTNAEILRQKAHNVVYEGDFLEYNEKGYDFIFMNPPFDGTKYIDHILHALTLLNDEPCCIGQLYAVVPKTLARTDKKTMDFWSKVACDGSIINEYTNGEFKSAGTLVSTCLIEMSNNKNYKINDTEQDLWSFTMTLSNNDYNVWQKFEKLFQSTNIELAETNNWVEFDKKCIELIQYARIEYARKGQLICYNENIMPAILHWMHEQVSDYSSLSGITNTKGNNMNLTEKYLNLKIKSNGKYPKYFEIIAKMIDVSKDLPKINMKNVWRGVEKEAWEMTFDELKKEELEKIKLWGERTPPKWFSENYDIAVTDRRTNKSYYGYTMYKFTPEHLNNFGKQAHYNLIKKAISAGKQVPANVLKDYPDLETEYNIKNNETRQTVDEIKNIVQQGVQKNTLYDKIIEEWLKVVYSLNSRGDSALMLKDLLEEKYPDLFDKTPGIIKYFLSHELPSKAFQNTNKINLIYPTDITGSLSLNHRIGPKKRNLQGLNLLKDFVSKDKIKEGMIYVYYDKDENCFVATDSFKLVRVNTKHPAFLSETSRYNSNKSVAYLPQTKEFIPLGKEADFPPYRSVLVDWVTIQKEFSHYTINVENVISQLLAAHKITKFAEFGNEIYETQKLRVKFNFSNSHFNYKRLLDTLQIFYDLGYKELTFSENPIEYKPFYIYAKNDLKSLFALIMPLRALNEDNLLYITIE